MKSVNLTVLKEVVLNIKKYLLEDWMYVGTYQKDVVIIWYLFKKRICILLLR